MGAAILSSTAIMQKRFNSELNQSLNPGAQKEIAHISRELGKTLQEMMVIRDLAFEAGEPLFREIDQSHQRTEQMIESAEKNQPEEHAFVSKSQREALEKQKTEVRTLKNQFLEQDAQGELRIERARELQKQLINVVKGFDRNTGLSSLTSSFSSIQEAVNQLKSENEMQREKSLRIQQSIEVAHKIATKTSLPREVEHHRDAMKIPATSKMSK